MDMDMNRATVTSAVPTDIAVAPARVSWGAIAAGWVVAAGVAWLFYQLGAAIGLTVADPAKDPTVIDRGFSIGAGVWILLTWMASLFVGGWFAGRFAPSRTRNSGAMHGLAVWGLTAVISIVVGFVGLANLAQGGASLIGGGVSLGASAAGGGGAQEAMQGAQNLGLDAEIKQAISQGIAQAGGGNVSPQQVNQAMAQLDGQKLAQIGARLLRGDTEGAKSIIAINTNLNRQQIDGVVNNVQAQVPRYKQQAAEAAQKATQYTSALMWVMFVSTLLALGLAMLGGAVGSRSGPDTSEYAY